MSARGVWEGRCRCTALASLFVVARVERVPLYLWLCGVVSSKPGNWFIL